MSFGIILVTVLVSWILSTFIMWIINSDITGSVREERIAVTIVPVINTIALLIIIGKESYKELKSIINE